MHAGLSGLRACYIARLAAVRRGRLPAVGEAGRRGAEPCCCTSSGTCLLPAMWAPAPAPRRRTRQCSGECTTWSCDACRHADHEALRPAAEFTPRTYPPPDNEARP